MSYLVDALRKAERERHSDRATGMASLSSAAPWMQRASGRRMRWIVGLLVACNIALLLYLLLPQTFESHTAVAKAPAAAAAPASLERSRNASAAVNTPAMPLPVEKPAIDTGHPRLAARQRPAAQPATPQFEPRESFPAAGDRLQNSYAPAVPMPASRDVPEITINGHLYSATPGQSFILVGGGIYHEGERLPAGPAIVRIDNTGAVLNYRGRRYHVDGPG